jgi:hypothetical protein
MPHHTSERREVRDNERGCAGIRGEGVRLASVAIRAWAHMPTHMAGTQGRGAHTALDTRGTHPIYFHFVWGSNMKRYGGMWETMLETYSLWSRILWRMLVRTRATIRCQIKESRGSSITHLQHHQSWQSAIFSHNTYHRIFWNAGA